MAIKPSLSLAILLSLSHLLAGGVAFLAALPVLPRLAMFVLIALSLVYYLARDALLLLPHSWKEVSVAPAGASVVVRNGSHFSGTVAGKTFVCPYFVVLGICPEGRRVPVFRVVFPDAIGQDAFRDLCVRLRFA